MKNEIVIFTDGDLNIEVQVNPEQETVWLSQNRRLNCLISGGLILANILMKFLSLANWIIFYRFFR